MSFVRHADKDEEKKDLTMTDWLKMISSWFDTELFMGFAIEFV